MWLAPTCDRPRSRIKRVIPYRLWKSAGLLARLIGMRCPCDTLCLFFFLRSLAKRFASSKSSPPPLPPSSLSWPFFLPMDNLLPLPFPHPSSIISPLLSPPPPPPPPPPPAKLVKLRPISVVAPANPYRVLDCLTVSQMFRMLYCLLQHTTTHGFCANSMDHWK